MADVITASGADIVGLQEVDSVCFRSGQIDQAKKQEFTVLGIDFEEVGVLTKTEFNAILECILQSSSTKRKIKRLLQA